MSESDRRRLLLRAAATAMAWPLMAALPVRAHDHGARFAPPHEPMLYRRTLMRELPGDASFEVGRSFAIRFEHMAGGFRVTGEQVSVEVEAPPSLAPFAELERQRHEVRLFPITLDGQGRIAGYNDGQDRELIEAALRDARSRIANTYLPDADRARYEAFVNAIHQSASHLVSALPADLFAPTDTDREVSRDIALPGGDSGRILATFHASTDPLTGLMREARREVVSELAGSRRCIRESWKLTPLGQTPG